MTRPAVEASAAFDSAGFICANTSIFAPPHVPEIQLHLASELNPIWRRTEEELQAVGIAPPFWAFAWAGGQGLARHLLDHPQLVAGRSVLDFACGSGLAGIAAAKAGAGSVICTDIDGFCQQAVTLNSALNGVETEFSAADPVGQPVASDIVLAGDVFYDRALAERIVPWFSSLADSGKTILVGDPGRAYLPRARLTELAVYQVPTTRELEDAEVKRTTVWQFS